MSAQDVRIPRDRLGTLIRLAAGGQGVVYSAPSISMAHAASMVYKEYKPTVAPQLDVTALDAMPLFLEGMRYQEGISLLNLMSWPCRVVHDNGVVCGFVMPRLPDEFHIQMHKATGMSREVSEFQHLLNPAGFLDRRKINITDKQRYQLVAALADALQTLHGHGIVVGDLSPKNVLFSAKPKARVYFLDCDAFRLRGASPLPQLETPGWEVRAVNPTEELATPQSDGYKLGLLALRLLVGDQSTRDPGRLPSHVPYDVRHLVEHSLGADPNARPAPFHWAGPLANAIKPKSTRSKKK